MSGNHSSVQLCPTIKTTIEDAIAGATAEVSGGGGHYRIRVVSAVFEGKSMLQKQRLVYRAIAALMSGPDAPLHAVDELLTEVPA
ncbi:MAG: acid stress-induced BolA-like protein IbaG/YrbA [Myxococcota bacterium]|jgi:acid stress-induced BolA-like protein IbaG/YrbA